MDSALCKQAEYMQKCSHSQSHIWRCREKFPLRMHYSGSCGAEFGSKIPFLTPLFSNESLIF
jgi:hypothetical protein